VTEVEEMKFRRRLSTALAIEAVAAERSPSIRTAELSTRYYDYLREIEESAPAAALLKFWRDCRQTAAADMQQEFELLFWECERICLGAERPHNVTTLRPRK
jgi:hypothetical protein